MPNLQQIAKQARHQSETQREKEVRLLDALLVHGNEGTADLSGKRHDEGINFLKLLLLTDAFNNLWMGREAAVTGYPVQAMTLCRCALEDWTTISWVDKHPKAIDRWLWAVHEDYERPIKNIPSFGNMWQELGDVGATAQDAYDCLSQFAHPKGIGLRWLIRAEDGNSYFHSGSYFSLVDLDTALYFLVMVAQMLLGPVLEVQKAFNYFNKEWIQQGQQLTDDTVDALIRMNKAISSQRGQ